MNSALVLLLVALCATQCISYELDDAPVGESKERSFDKVPASQTLAKNPKLWQAAKKGDVSALKKHLAKVKVSGGTNSAKAGVKALVKAVKTMKRESKKQVAKRVAKATKAIKKAIKKRTPNSPTAVKNSVACSLMREENAALQTSKELLTYENARVTVDRNQNKRSATYLGAQNSKLREQIADLKIATAKEGKLFSGNMKIIADNTRLAAENSVLSTQTSNLQKSVSAKVNIIAKHEVTIANARAKIVDKDVTLKKKEQAITALQQQLSAEKAKSAKLAANLLSTQKALAAQKTANQQLQKKNGGLRKDLAAAAKRYAKQGAELSHQMVLHKSLTARNQKLQAQAAASMAKVGHGDTCIATSTLLNSQGLAQPVNVLVRQYARSRAAGR